MQLNIHVLPILHHVRPAYNVGRHQHHTHLLRKYGTNWTTLCTDTSAYPQQPAQVTTIARFDSTALMSVTPSEEATIAFAMTQATSLSITILTPKFPVPVFHSDTEEK